MLEALIVTLREGIEAALVVGIIVAFLRREGLAERLGAVWAGIAAAVAASFAGAFLLYRAAINEEVFEGLLYLFSAIVVASMLAWMWRHAHELSGEVKGTLGKIVARGAAGRSVWGGLFLFTFLMVVREGIETVLFLSALSLSTGGLAALLGSLLGIVLAIAFGVLFVRGSLRIDLQRFFAVTGVALCVFVVQLLCNAYHELSEAGWLPASPRTMAILGPLVSNEFFFVAAVLILPLLMLLIPGREPEAPASANPAEDRLRRAQSARQRRARSLAGALGIAALVGLGLHKVYGEQAPSLSPAEPVTPVAGLVRLPLAGLRDGKLHRYVATVEGSAVRFIAIATGEADGRIATALDACEICGTQGYYEESGQIFCLHCRSVVYTPSIGKAGGCNPIPLASRIEGADLVIAVTDLAPAAPRFR